LSKAFMVMVTALALMGCQTMAIKRDVTGRTFTSGIPKFSVTVPETMEYVGDSQKARSGTSTKGVATRNKIQWWAFAQTGEIDKQIHNSLVIKIISTDMHGWVTNLVPSKSWVVDSGRFKIGSKQWQWYSTNVPGSSGYLFDYFKSLGYTIGRGKVCCVMRSSGQSLISLIYYENKWNNDAPIATIKDRFLSQFKITS